MIVFSELFYKPSRTKGNTFKRNIYRKQMNAVIRKPIVLEKENDCKKKLI